MLVPAALTSTLANMLDWPRQALDVQAPARFATLAGTSHAIDYADVAGLSVDVRVQELFGLSVHLTVAGVPLLLRLLPAHRV